MKTTSIFRGAATALVTPLTASGVDYEAFGRLIDWQIESGINALVIAGTTGEGSTLSDEEHREVMRYAAQRNAGRVPMIAGTGSNDTNYAISLSQEACELGYDALLCVTPYYNKATQRGLIEMYTAIANAVDKPLILYNVPSRTGVNIEPSTYDVLADHPNVHFHYYRPAIKTVGAEMHYPALAREELVRRLVAAVVGVGHGLWAVADLREHVELRLHLLPPERLGRAGAREVGVGVAVLQRVRAHGVPGVDELLQLRERAVVETAVREERAFRPVFREERDVRRPSVPVRVVEREAQHAARGSRE